MLTKVYPSHFLIVSPVQWRSLLLVFLLVMYLWPDPVPGQAQSGGQTYYVAMDGSDAQTGSQAAPWATLQHAVDQVIAGDTIQVMSGTYAGARLERSGAAGAYISLKAAPGASVLVDRPGLNNKHASNLEVETWEGDGLVAYWVIEGLEVANAPGWGIDIRGGETAMNHHITVRANRVHDNGQSGVRTGIFAAFSNDLLIEANESYANSEHGIYINNSSDRFTVRANRLHHNQNSGLHLNGDLSMGGDGILSDGLIESNKIYENGQGGGAGINMDGVTGTLVRNNLLYANYASGIAIFQQDGAVCSQDNRFYHNTILMPADGRWGVIVSDPACRDNRLFNNIIYSDHSYRGSLNLAGGAPPGFESDYNVLVDRLTIDDGDSILSLNQWQALGYDLHSLMATPQQLFVDLDLADYHLKAGSPAIDRGMALPAEVPTDWEGDLRPSGAGFDLGVDEFRQAEPGPPSAWLFLPLINYRSNIP